MGRFASCWRHAAGTALVDLRRAGDGEYDASIGRFIQADTIVPAPGNPQSLNRYAYVYNNPLRYTDPSGHDPRKPREHDTAWSYILWEMDTNARSLTVSVVHSANSASLAPAVIAVVFNTSPASQSTLVAAAGLKGISYGLFGDKVRYGGDWDHKSPIWDSYREQQKVPGVGRVEHDVWSNIHYGYVGSAAGFGERELLGAAGIAQFAHTYWHWWDGYREAYRSEIREGRVGLHTYYDWPQDQLAIALGIHLWHEYGLSLTEAQFLRELREWGIGIPFKQTRPSSPHELY